MTVCQLMEAVLKGIFGTDAEMDHPKTREDMEKKILEAHKNIDDMNASTDRLSRVTPAKNLDEALRQITGG